ncbi:MAG: ABC transporter substrate-binding protein [Emcibacteraceae bacterium]|nr:ABC transporter substrate-binding protein [Emcibacteraceae bacterium]
MMRNNIRNKAISMAKTEEHFVIKYRKLLLSFLLSIVIFAAFTFSNNAFADNKDPAEQQKAREFIEDFSEKAIAILNNKGLTDEETVGEYRNILHEAFAIDYIARISLSRHRKKASKEELDQYFELFPEFILTVNSTRLKKLDTTKIEIDKVTPHAKVDIFIRTKAYNSDNKPIDVDWRVRSDKQGNVKIIDIKVEGISLVATQRDDFTSRISSSGVGGLNKYMKDIIDGTTFAEKEENS